METDLVIPVTVLMPVFDTPVEMLRPAIDSILGQTFSEFEFLIIDDGSRKSEVRSCLTRRIREDSRIRVEWTAHAGITAALNRGLRGARGEWIARQDADDWSAPQRLERQVAFLRANPAIGLCGTAAWTHQRNGSPLWLRRLPCAQAAILDAFQTSSPFVHGSVVFRRDAALALGGYRQAFRFSQDYDFLWRLTETAGGANLTEPLYHYRYSGGAISANRAVEQAKAHDAAQKLARDRQRGEVEDVRAALASGDDPQLERFAVLKAELKQADHLMLAGEYGAAWRAYRRVLFHRPGSATAWAKLARCGIFVTVPPAREACFR